MSILMDFLEEQVGKSKKQQSAGDWLETTLKDADKCVWCTNSGRYTHSSADKNAAVLVPYHPNIKGNL